MIVKDDYFIASDLANGFTKAHFEIVGPVPSLGKALATIEAESIGGAVLDINLDGEKVYEVADALIARGVPVVFVTGYERKSSPGRYAQVPLCLKPVDAVRVVAALGVRAGRAWQRRDGGQPERLHDDHGVPPFG